MRLYQRKYARSQKRRAKIKQYIENANGKQIMKKVYSRYNKSKKGKKRDNKYNQQHPERRKAKAAVDKAIRTLKLPKPNSLVCCYCTKSAELYHHHKGYEPEHWLDVIPVCRKCHIAC